MPPMPPERATTIELWTEPLEAPPQPRAKEDNVPKLIDNGPQKTPPTAESEDGEPRDVTTKTIWKNVLAISVAFMLSYTAFQSIQNLESSLISEQNLGTSSLSCVYGVFILSCNAAPFIIHNIGTKWTIVLGLIGNVIFTTVHFHPHHYTLIPTSIMLGILAGPLWSAQCTHLITCAVRYASMTNETIDVVISQFTGIFYMMYGMTQIFGNVISAAILDQQHPIESNETIYLERTCGAYDSGINDIDSTVLPSQHSQNILFAVYVVFGLVAVLVTIPMDTLDWIRGGKRWAEGEVVNMSIGCMCMSTIQMLRNPNVLLLVSFLVYCGMEQAFLFGDFTLSYVSCTIGVESVGFVMICYGASDSACAFLAGRLSKYCGKNILLAVAGVVSFVLMTVLLTWEPSPEDVVIFFVITGGWGLADGIWQTQLSTILGDLFGEQLEAIFALGKMLQALGFTVTFAYSGLLPVFAKIYILGTVLFISLLGYVILELRLRGKSQPCGRRAVLEDGYDITQI